jgi:hypothetical protein
LFLVAATVTYRTRQAHTYEIRGEFAIPVIETAISTSCVVGSIPIEKFVGEIENEYDL